MIKRVLTCQSWMHARLLIIAGGCIAWILTLA